MTRRPAPASTARARPISRQATGLGAALALLVLLAGPPVALILLVGWPGPHSWPTLAGLGHGLTAPLAAGTVLKFVTILGWLAWAHLLVCVAAEVRAELSDRPARRIPLGGASQRLAHQLVVSVLIALGAGPTLTVTGHAVSAVVLTRAAAPAAYTTALAAVRPEQPPRPTSPAECLVPPTADPGRQASVSRSALLPESADLRVYVVAPPDGRWHDNLWDIAERHLGDGQRWREIYQLNEGRLQPDGGRLTRANLIRPAWVLLLPADATRLPADADVPPVIPRQGQPRPVAPDHSAPRSVPPAPTREPSVSGEAPVLSPTDGHPRSTPPGRAVEPAAPITPAGVGLGVGLGLGLAAAAATLRRAAVSAQHHRRRDRRPRPQPPAAAAIRRAADQLEPVADRVRQAVRLAAAQAPHGTTVRAVLAQPDGAIDILFTDPAVPPPAPFTEPAPGRWRLPAEAGPFTYAIEADPDPAPALAPIGRLDNTDVFLNLEAVGLLALTGPIEQTAPIAAGIALGLTGAPWAALAHVHTAHGLLPQLPGIDRLDTVDPDPDNLTQLVRYADRVRAELADSDTPTVAAARAAGDATTPLLLLAGISADALPDELAVAGRDPASPLLAVLLGAHPDAEACQLDEASGLLRVPGLGELTPVRAEPGELATLADTLAAVRVPLADPAVPAPHPSEPTPAATSGTRGQAVQARVIELTPPDVPADDPTYQQARDQAPAAESATGIEVCILGPVELLGAPAPRRLKVLELIVYLALHRSGVDSEKLSTALWPDKPYHLQVVSQRLAEARALLDAAISKGPVHRLDPTIGSDWQRFQTLAAGDPSQKRAALALLRGRPFDGLGRRCEWIYAENHVSEICSAAADLARDLAETDLAHGDYPAAETAAAAGIKVNPYEESLYLLAATAAAEAGRPGMVQIYAKQLHTVIEDEADLADRVHPDTDRELDRLHTLAQRCAARQAG
ncbi:MAG TPA: hypothetical protein VNG13_10390 [Mycobacteriales bacterium]|nr:hypothetical protein [Mycobacteriales bacterium]